jgi:hypothetical protein
MCEREAIDAIRIELAARSPHTLWYFSTSGLAVHFIIRADNLFFFKALFIPDDHESWTCTYQWQMAVKEAVSCDKLELFHNPLTTADSHTAILDREADDRGAGKRASDLHSLVEERHEQPS